jgi:signal peptidase I
LAGSDRSSSDPSPAGAGRRFGDVLIVLGVTVLAALLVKTFLLDATRVASRSMTDVLQPGDFVLVNKFLYGPRTPFAFSGRNGPLPALRLPALRDPRSGDILLFQLPSRPGREGLRSAPQYLKRCVAGPGDSIAIGGGSVLVNGRLFATLEGDTSTRVEMRIPRPGDTVRAGPSTTALLRGLIDRDLEVSGDPGDGAHVPLRPDAGVPGDAPHRVVNEFYFVLGDRSSVSVDSRHWGLVPRAWVIGTPIAVYWSVEPAAQDGDLPRRWRGVRWHRIGRPVR